MFESQSSSFLTVINFEFLFEYDTGIYEES